MHFNCSLHSPANVCVCGADLLQRKAGRLPQAARSQTEQRCIHSICWICWLASAKLFLNLAGDLYACSPWYDPADCYLADIRYEVCQVPRVLVLRCVLHAFGVGADGAVFRAMMP